MFALREPFVLGEAAKVEASGAIGFSPALGRNPAPLPPHSPSFLALGSAQSRAVPMPRGCSAPGIILGTAACPGLGCPPAPRSLGRPYGPFRGPKRPQLCAGAAWHRGQRQPRLLAEPGEWCWWCGARLRGETPRGSLPARLQRPRWVHRASDRSLQHPHPVGTVLQGSRGSPPGRETKTRSETCPGQRGRGGRGALGLQALLRAVCTGRCRLDRSLM